MYYRVWVMKIFKTNDDLEINSDAHRRRDQSATELMWFYCFIINQHSCSFKLFVCFYLSQSKHIAVVKSRCKKFMNEFLIISGTEFHLSTFRSHPHKARAFPVWSFSLVLKNLNTASSQEIFACRQNHWNWLKTMYCSIHARPVCGAVILPQRYTKMFLRW